MAKKPSEIIQAQMGFGFEVMDKTGRTPEFLCEPNEVYSALDEIAQAQWVSVDIESTGLTEASVPVSLTAKEVRQGKGNAVRMRTIQARVPTVNGLSGPRIDFAFDADKMSRTLTQEVCEVILERRMFIAHNAGFDLYWLRRAQGRSVMPGIVADSMLLTRLLNPKLVLERARLVESIRSNIEITQASELQKAAWNSLLKESSGSSLADVVLSMFGEVVDKTYQKPTSWTGLLGFDHYDYAISDVIWADRIMCNLLDIAVDEGDILGAYLERRDKNALIKLIEPQVPDLVLLRETGMPMNEQVAQNYARTKEADLVGAVDVLIDLEPSLASHRTDLANVDAGMSNLLKKTLAAAFTRRGLKLRKTEATGTEQVGEKDLRAVRAAKTEEARPLFDAWVNICKTKKTRQMVLETIGFAQRSDDGRLHSLLSHGPVTGRLSASEPNCQQWPRDQLFRAMCISPTKPGCEQITLTVTEINRSLLAKALFAAPETLTLNSAVTVDTAWITGLFWSDSSVHSWPKDDYIALKETLDKQFTHVIIASDFGALDVRVGAALCIRSQREMLDIAKGLPVPGQVQPEQLIVDVIKDVVRYLDLPDRTEALEALSTVTGRYDCLVRESQAHIEKLKADESAGRITRTVFFTKLRGAKLLELSRKLGWRLAQCLRLGLQRGEREYSALRDAFVAGIDIHTFTGMKLVGRDPMKEFEGLDRAQRSELEKKLKKELGPRRQQGKIANLSLLYGMADAGFQEAAARNYNEHWTLEESHDIRMLWMNAYPEVELWHLWTQCLQAGVVYVPDPTRDRPQRTSWWLSRTLSGREIVAFGINSALSYQDQSSGADILGLIMHRLNRDYPEIFKTSINQVHDEQVFCVPVEKFDEYLPIIERVMVEEADSQTMRYGVPTAVSPACGPIWVKD